MTIYKLIGGGERAMQLFGLGRDIICIEEDIEEKYVCPERCNGFTKMWSDDPDDIKRWCEEWIGEEITLHIEKAQGDPYPVDNR